MMVHRFYNLIPPDHELGVVVPDRATFEYSYCVSPIRTNRATVLCLCRCIRRQTPVATIAASSVQTMTKDLDDLVPRSLHLTYCWETSMVIISLWVPRTLMMKNNGEFHR